MTRLNLGSGVAMLGGFVNCDFAFTEEQIRHGWETKTGPCRNALIEPDSTYVQASILELDQAFPASYADYVLLDNVIEHFPMALVATALKQIYRVLKPGGRFVVMAPDFNCLARIWEANIGCKEGSFRDWMTWEYIAEVIYGNQIGPGEYHRTPITADYLNWQLTLAGFRSIEIVKFPMHSPGPEEGRYPGIHIQEGGLMRTDNLTADCRKPLEDEPPVNLVVEQPAEEQPAPPPLGISVAESVRVKTGLR